MSDLSLPVRRRAGIGCCSVGSTMLSAVSLALWAVIIFLPLVVLFAGAVFSLPELRFGDTVFACLCRSFVLAAVIGAVAVLLGYTPARLLGTRSKGQCLLLLLLLMPLVLPRYLFYYAWTLLLSPTTHLGTYLAGRGELARLVHGFASCSVLVLWYWPLAALVLAQGWRNIDRQIWDCASLDAGRTRIFTRITLPLLGRPMLLAFGICFVLSLSEFATFHLAGVRTVGTELAVLYQQTGSDSAVAVAASPIAAAALVVSVLLARKSRSWALPAAAPGPVRFESQRWWWCCLFALVAVSLVVPVGLLLINITQARPFVDFLTLHLDGLLWSLAIAVVASIMAHLIAFAGLPWRRTDRSLFQPGPRDPNVPVGSRGSYWRRCLSYTARITIFLAMFIPASLVAVSLLRMLALCKLPASFRQGWYIVSAGQAARFAGVVLIIFVLARSSHIRQLTEMASVDGASNWAVWRHVHLPRTWPLFVGSFFLVVMLSVTELSATMVLLPAGLPNFAQRLLNQMHYLREQSVIASCLILTVMFLIMAIIVVLLMRTVRTYWQVLLLVITAGIFLTGCDDKTGLTAPDYVLGAFGRTGRGRSEFMYPRALDVAKDGSLFVVDKTGRIQHLTKEGQFLDAIKMPLVEAGKPTGVSVGPNGNLYVADTHYYRVVVFSPDGELIDQFGRYGEEPGCFIYPTDVALAEDGRIFVSEYGGNDRVSVFDRQKQLLYCFGTCGSGEGQFARPSALCIDQSRKRLYVADACNHRIAIYDLDGKLIGYIGSVGQAAGRLRYPYDLALLSDGTLVVCEYGNNRLQLFSPEGKSLAVYGGPGRQLGQLAYPWGVAVGAGRRAFVVDAGNNRIQIWRL